MAETEVVVVVTVVVVGVKTIEEEGVAIAAEVISWRGLLSMDTRMNRPHLVCRHTSVFMFDISAECSKVEVSNTTTLPLINGDWGADLI